MNISGKINKNSQLNTTLRTLINGIRHWFNSWCIICRNIYPSFIPVLNLSHLMTNSSNFIM